MWSLCAGIECAWDGNDAMLVTQKCQYALRAIFALARRGSERPVKIAQIAEEQAIPFRFLEVILGQLKQGGFVESRRGTEGGYRLARRPDQISVGDIVRFVDGSPINPQSEAGVGRPNQQPDAAEPDVFMTVWRQAEHSVFEVFDAVTISELIVRDDNLRARFIPNFEI